MRLLPFMRPLMYLDPGTGSLMIQFLLAGLLGIAVVIRVYWKKIIGFFSKYSSKSNLDEVDDLDEYQDESSD